MPLGGLVWFFPELVDTLLLMKPSHYGSVFWVEKTALYQNDEYVTYFLMDENRELVK